MIARIAPALSAFALLAAQPAGAAVNDFRLPSSTPSATPRAQGPVDPDNPAPRPAPTPTPTPTPTPGAAPAPTPAPSPRLTLPPVTPTPRATPAPANNRPALAPRASAAASAEPRTPTAGATPAPTSAPISVPTPAVPGNLPAPGTQAALPSVAAAPPEGEGLPWGWIVLAGLAVGAAGAGWYARGTMARRKGSVLMVPDIEKPRVPAAPTPPAMPAPEPQPAPAEAAEPTHPLLIAITPVKLTQTFMNETLSYRLSLTNVGAEPLEAVAIAADLIGAHASLTREEQLAGPGTDLPLQQTLAGIAPGETVETRGEVRTPLAELSVIRQGRATLVVPLARFRVSAPGMETRHFTLAVGQQQPGASTLAPIRLDLGPRSTDGLAGRAF